MSLQLNALCLSELGSEFGVWLVFEKQRAFVIGFRVSYAVAGLASCPLPGGLVSRALGERAEKMVFWVGAGLVALGVFVDAKPVKFNLRSKW